MLRALLTLAVLLALLRPGTAAAWASQDDNPFCDPVHQLAVKNVLSSQALRPAPTDADIGLLQKAQLDTDAPANQTAGRSFLHAMTGQAVPPDVCARRCPDGRCLKLCFIESANAQARQDIQTALDLGTGPRHAEAMAHLGELMHMTMDATSPAHAGFQLWSDTESTWQKYLHVRQELVYPADDPGQGARGRLEDAVLWVYRIYQHACPVPERFFDPASGDLQLWRDCPDHGGRK